MTQTHQHTRAATQFTLLAEFSWGESNVARYCRWNSDLVVDGQTFSAEPLFNFRQTKAADGGTSDTEGEIFLPKTRQPLANGVRPYRHAAVRVKVYEYVPSEGLNSKRLLFVGKLGKLTSRRQAQGSLIRAVVKGIKAELNIRRVGVQCTSTCQHIFGDSDCGFDLAGNTLSGSVSGLQVDGLNTRIALDFSGSPTINNSRFARGVVRVDGLSITIRQIVSVTPGSDPTAVVDLKDAPPPEWSGETAALVPGCRLRLSDCQDLFRDRESQFLGLGYAMLPYNPSFYNAPGGNG